MTITKTKIIYTILTTILLTSPTLQRISPIRPFRRTQVLPKDKLFAPLQIFMDLSRISRPMDFYQTQNLRVGSEITHFDQAHYGSAGSQARWTKKIHTDAVLVCLSRRDFVFQDLLGGGREFAQNFRFSLPSGYNCHDAVPNVVRNILYITCTETVDDLTRLHVVTYKFDTNEILRTTQTDLPEGFSFSNRAAVMIGDVQNNGEIDSEQEKYFGPYLPNQSTTFLFVYDQGSSKVKSTLDKEKYLFMFRGVEFGRLRFFRTLVPGTLTSSHWAHVLDYFSYNGNLIISGRRKGAENNIISMSRCTVKLQNDTYNCQTNFKTTEVLEGRVGLTSNQTHYFQIDSAQNLIFIAKLAGTFDDPFWNTNIVSTKQNLDLPQQSDISITNYSGDSKHGLIVHNIVGDRNWAINVVGFEENFDRLLWEHAGSSLGGFQLIIRNGFFWPPTGYLIRPIESFVYLKAQDLEEKESLVSIEVGDQETLSPQSTSQTITKMDTIFDAEIGVNFELPSTTFKRGSETLIEIRNSNIDSGNGLNLEITSPNGKVTGKGFNQVTNNITFSPAPQNPIHYAFSFHGAVVQTATQAHFYTCEYSDNFIDIQCKEFAKIEIDENSENFKNYIVEAGSIHFVWTCGQNGCYAVVAFIDPIHPDTNVHVYRVGLEDDTVSAYMSLHGLGRTMFRIVQTDLDRVYFRRGDVFSTTSVRLYHEINSRNSGTINFCPIEVTHKTSESSEVHIYNACQGLNHNIYVFKVSNADHIPRFQNLIHIPTRQQTHFCSTRHEIFFFKHGLLGQPVEIASVPHVDDLNLFSIPNDLTGSNPHLQCITHQDYVVIYNQQGRGQENTINSIIVIKGSQGHAQATRFPFVQKGTQFVQGEAYESPQGIIHWLKNSGGDDVFVTTFFAPKVRMTVASDAPTQNFDVFFEFSNENEGVSRRYRRHITVTEQFKGSGREQFQFQ